jgi:hypothetical protein
MPSLTELTLKSQALNKLAEQASPEEYNTARSLADAAVLETYNATPDK